MTALATFLEQRTGRSWATTVFVLDHVHNPANVGMILRTAVAADLDGVVVPDRGTAEIGPVAITASAGVAFHAPILRADRTPDAVRALRDARFELIGLDAAGDDLFATELPDRVAVVLGGETDGITVDVDRRVGIPLANGVDSLNVAAAAAVVAFELVRRR